MKPSLVSIFFAELIGTFLLSIAVLMTLFPSTTHPITTPVAAALTLGLMVYLLGNISGCHINPAVSFAMTLLKKLSVSHFILYIIAQIIGGLLAYAVAKIYILTSAGQLGDWLVPTQSSLVMAIGEFVGTTAFVFGIFAAIYNNVSSKIIGLVIGTSLLVGIIVSHNFSYGMLNPAVALATRAWNWNYLLVPFFGALLGGMIALLLFKSSMPHQD